MIIALLRVLWIGAASAQVPRQVGLGEVRVEDDRRIVALTIDEVEGVLAVDINIVLDSRAVTVLDFVLTDLLPGFFAFHNGDSDTLKFAAASAQAVGAGSGVFAELHLEDTGATPQLLFAVVALNGDEIPVEFALRWTKALSRAATRWIRTSPIPSTPPRPSPLRWLRPRTWNWSFTTPPAKRCARW